MKGWNPSRICHRVSVWVGVLLLCTGAHRGQAGQEGAAGVSAKQVEINLTELAAKSSETETGQPGKRAVPRAKVRRKSATPIKSPLVSKSGLKKVDSANPSAEATSSFALAGGPSGNSPAPSASFQALPDNETAYNPDTHGAVGPNHLLTTLASQVRVQSRTGSNMLTMSLKAFWSATGKSNIYDPRVLYDAVAQRWIAVAVDDPSGVNNSSILIGASATSDPTGAWHLRVVPADALNQLFPISPNVGFTKDWITVAVPMYTEEDPDNVSFYSSDIWVFNKTNLYAGGSGQFTYFRYLNPEIDEASVLVPAVTLDPTYSTNFLVANWHGNDAFGNGYLRLFSIGGPVNAPVFEDYEAGISTTNGLFAGLAANWESYPPGFGDFAPQSGASGKILIGDARIQNVVFRNAALWCTHHIFLPAGTTPTRCSIQWFSLTPGGNITQTGRIDDNTGVKFYAYPSLAVNGNEDVLIGFSRFGANQFPSANYSFASSENMILRADAVLKAGENSFTLQDPFESIRWGDWSATVVDPLNDVDFWTIQEYAASPGTTHWGTWWGRVAPPTDLTLGVTASSNVVLAGANITYSLAVTNNALTTATGVILSNTLPVGAQFVSAVSPFGGCTYNAGVVICNLGDMPGETFATATIVATLTQSPTSTNTAVVFGFGPEEGLPADNTVKTLTTVNTSADLAVLVSASSNPVTVSNNLTYVVVVTNRGPSAATGVGLTNTLPAGIAFISAVPGAGQGSCSQSAGIVTCNLGSLGSGGSATVTIVARPNSAGQLTNRAVALTAVPDPSLLNNTNIVITRANAAPTMQFLSDRSIQEDGTLVLNFTVSDLETLATNLQVVALSSNQVVVPNANISIENAGGSRVLTLSPAANASGRTFIKRIVTDADGASTTNEIMLDVIEVPDRPTISPIANVRTNEDSTVGPISFTIGDVETPGSLTVSGASSNPQLIPNANINITPSGLSRTVTLTPLANSNGVADITLTVSDGGLTTNRTFTVTVDSVNDLPTITDITNRVVNEDVSTGLITFTVGDIETAPGSLVLGRLSSNQTLVPTNNIIFGGTGNSRTVTVSPAANEVGTAVITVSVIDGNGGSTNDTFQITVNQVNDPPTFNLMTTTNILEDAGLQVVPLTGITVGPTNEAQTNRITATSNNPGLILNLTTNYSPLATTGSISFTPAPNSNGTAVITVTVDDGGASNNVLVRTLTVNVAAVNDPPFISDIPDRSTTEDVATGQIPFVLGDIDSPLGSLTFSGRCADTNLVPNANFQFSGSGSNWTVNITPAPNRFGTNTISIFVTDGAATNSDTFILSVQAVNDPPTISSIGAATINEDVTTNISFSIGDAETLADNLNLGVTTLNPALFSSLSFGGSGTSRTLNVVPAANQFGAASVTVSVWDSEGGTNFTTFVLTVNEVNDPPSIDSIDNLTIDEDSGQQTIPLTGITAGAPNENQTLSVTASAGGSSIVSNLQVTYANGSPNGTLRFTPVANSNGVAAITVSVNDGQATNARTFNVIIQSINDPPTISFIADPQIINEDVTTNLVFTVGDVETPLAQLSVQASSSNPELVDDQTGILIQGTDASRTLVLTPSPDESGFTQITVTVTDGGNEVASTTFELEVRAVNDRPTISGLTNDVTIAASAPNPVLPFTVSDPETIPSQLLLAVFSSNPALVTTNNLIVSPTGINRTLTIRPTAGQYGSSTIRVVVADGPGAGAGFATNSFVFSVINDPPTLGFINDITMNEDGGQRVVNLTGITSGSALESQTVVVTAVSSNTALIPNPVVSYVSPNTTGSLTFTPLPNANGQAIIRVTVDDQQTNNNTFSRTFLVTVLAANDAPTLAAIPDQTTLEDAQALVTVTVADIDNPVAGLVLFGLSSNTNLVPTNAMVFTGTTGSRELTITPRPEQSGSAQLSVVVTDAAGGFATNTFLLTVLATNDAPVIASLVNTNVNEDLQLSIAFKVSDPDDSPGSLELTATSSNPALLPVSRIEFGGSSSDRSMTLTPLPNQTGTVTLTITATDSYGVAASSSFVLTVNPVNDPPTLSGLPDLAVNEDSATGALTVSVGDVDTPLANLNLTASSGTIGLVPSGNINVAGTGASRTVTITPAANQSGSALITLTLSDGAGGTTNTSFTLTVRDVNDPPTLDSILNRNLNEDPGLQTVNLTGIGAGGGESQPLTVTATSSNPALIPTVTVTYTSPNPAGVLTFTPVANASGRAVIAVKVDDGQPQNSSIVRTFTVDVASTNDGPTIVNIADQSMLEDGILTVPFTIGDVETAGLSLTLSATSSNTTLLAVTNIQFSGAGTNRTVTLIPTPNLSGTSLVTVRVTDGVATNSDTFLLTVIPVNDPPTLTPISHFGTNAAGANPAYTVNLSGISSGATNENQTLLVTATSSNTVLLPNPTVSYTSPNTTATLTLRPGNNASGTSLITVTVNDQGTSNNTVVQTFLVSIRPSGNVAPTISTINNQTLLEDTPSASIPFTVSDAETAAGSLGLFFVSSNPALLPTNNIALGGSGNNRTMVLTPVPNASGTSAVTLTVTDGNSGSSNRTFTVTVLASNDVPAISSISDQTIAEDTATAALPFNVTDVETPAGSLLVTASSSSQAVVPNGNIVLGGSGTNRAVVVTPAANQAGSATITVTVSDGSASANAQFTVTVNAANDPPTISDVADVAINEDTPTTALAITVGDAETAAAALVMSASSSDTNLVPSTAFAFGGSNADRTLVITPATNQFGSATITVSVSDGTNQANDTFVLTVNATNDPPTLNAIGDRTIGQDAPLQTVALTGISSGAPNEDQALIVAASSSNPGLIPNPTVDYVSPQTTGSLSFRPVAGAVGSAVITVVVNDGQPRSNLVTRTFNVTVASAPVIAAVPNQVISEDRVGPTINITIADADSTLSAITLSATSSNPTLVPNATLSPGGTAGSRTLVITPTANEFGFSTITLTAQDPSGNVGTTSFLLTVAPVNDSPTLTAIGNRLLPVNAGIQTVDLSGISSGAPNEAQALVVSATSGNPAVIPHPTVDYVSPAGSGTLSFIPAVNATGSVVITVRLRDDGGTALGGTNEISRQFTVSVGVAPPQLRIDRVGANVIVSWSTNDAEGWSLRSGTNLANAASWNAVATAPSVVVGRYTVTNSAAGPARYYRLCSGCSTGMPQDASLSIRRVAGSVIVSWSSSVGDFALESAPSLSPLADWAPIGGVPVEADGKFSVTVDVEGAPRFFRLRGR